MPITRPLTAPETQVALGLGRKSMLVIGLLAGLCALSMLSSTMNLQSYINVQEEEVRGSILLRATSENEMAQNDISDTPTYTPSANPTELRKDVLTVDLRAAERYMYNQRRSLINESSAIKMSFNQNGKIGAMLFHYNFGDEIEYIGYTYEGGKPSTWRDTDVARRNSTLHRMANVSRGDLLHGQVCDVLNFFRETNGVRKHVLLSHFNENWGAFSTPVPNRTVNWGEWEMHFTNEGCKMDDLYWYLNHTNVSAVFTCTHQWIDHPKVFSVPLGVKDPIMIARQIELQKDDNRTELLLISQSSSDTRTPIANSVIANFNGTIQNRYRMAGTDYWQDLRNSKFILCPSGMGWDTYRAWEAMCLGTIPVLETYGRKDGMYRVYDDLPVLWVENYDNVTPALLEDSYPKILAKAEEYNFAKLTNQWWIDFVNSYRPNNGKRLWSSSPSTPNTTETKAKATAPEKCSVPRPVRVAKNRAGEQTLTPGHSNCTLGWREQPSVNFGQNLEDAVIYHRFFSGGSPLAHLSTLNGVNGGAMGAEGVERGIFLEMGALDGIKFSNTLMFEQCLGWNGLLIEANPTSFTKLLENRPCAITIGEAACKVDDGPTLRMTGVEGVATIVEDNAKDYVEVPCRPLNQMLEENGIDRINFFSLDVEGALLNVLQTLDWEKVKIDVLLVEADFVYTAQEGGTQDEKIKAVRDYVTSMGMVQVRSRLDLETDPSTGKEKDVSLCQRNGYKDDINCMFLSVAGSDVFVSPQLYEYDTKPWLYEDGQ
eukprot:scaffold22931_cov50-Cyclotella_meneghiniana.AAC.3